MKKITLFLLVFIIYSCSVKKYVYDLDLVKPTVSKDLTYTDDKLTIDFVLNDADMSLKIKNNSDKPLKIIWDEASFVNNGEAQKIIHKNVKFIDKEKSQAPTVIPPRSFIDETIQPIDDIKFQQQGYGRYTSYAWSAKPIFQTNYDYNGNEKKHKDKLKLLKGNPVNVYLPIQYDGKTIDYYFEMQVADILLRKNGKNIKSIFQE